MFRLINVCTIQHRTYMSGTFCCMCGHRPSLLNDEGRCSVRKGFEDVLESAMLSQILFWEEGRGETATVGLERPFTHSCIYCAHGTASSYLTVRQLPGVSTSPVQANDHFLLLSSIFLHFAGFSPRPHRSSKSLPAHLPAEGKTRQAEPA